MAAPLALVPWAVMVDVPRPVTVTRPVFASTLSTSSLLEDQVMSLTTERALEVVAFICSVGASVSVLCR